MNCSEIQERILNEPELASVEAHLRECCDCRAFREAAVELDAALSITPRSPETLKRAVLASITAKPTYLPELLDFVGWAAMLAVIIGIAGKLLAT